MKKWSAVKEWVFEQLMNTGNQVICIIAFFTLLWVYSGYLAQIAKEEREAKKNGTYRWPSDRPEPPPAPPLGDSN